jgi:hypothetical protein
VDAVLSHLAVQLLGLLCLRQDQSQL